jgi:hypothetical protein
MYLRRVFPNRVLPLAVVAVVAACGQVTGGDDESDAARDASTDAASDATATCPGDPVTFHLTAWAPESGLPATYCVSCGWLTIKSEDGMPIDEAGWCQVDCSGCTNRLCPPVVECPNTAFPAAGLTQTWDGTHYDPGTCGSNVACRARTCANSGSHWIATMCAYPGVVSDGGVACLSTGPAHCVDVPFDYPSPAPVVGTLLPLR